MNWKMLIYAAVLLLLFVLWCLGQDSTPWQLETQAKLDEAGRRAVLMNKSETVVIPSGRYEYVRLRIPGSVALVFGAGWASREGDLIYVGKGDEEGSITLAAGYGTCLAGCQIRGRTQQEPRVTAILVENVTNGIVANVRVDLRGIDCQGLVSAGKESLSLYRCELRASNPLAYRWGDNVWARDLDLGCSGKVDDLPSTVVRFDGMPHQVTIDGCTAQGGDHLVWGEVDSEGSGQGLNLFNVRWEQSTSTQSSDKAAIHLRFLNRRLENLLIVGSRWTDRKRAFNTTGITQTTVTGSRLVGTQ